MKKIFLASSLILCITVTTSSAQAIAQASTKPNTSATAGMITFKEAANSHDFGTIPQGTPVSYNFAFTNTGKAPLVLSNAAPSCGCVVAEYPKDAIAPGKSGVIKVTYNAAAPNSFMKTVTVSSNATEPAVVLNIKGEVKPAVVEQQVAPKQNLTPKKN